MSLPMAATGPLNVLMKPILTLFSWATAGPAKSASAAAAKTPILIIACIPLVTALVGAEAFRWFFEA
jgi:hypothetical protein